MFKSSAKALLFFYRPVLQAIFFNILPRHYNLLKYAFCKSASNKNLSKAAMVVPRESSGLVHFANARWIVMHTCGGLVRCGGLLVFFTNPKIKKNV